MRFRLRRVLDDGPPPPPTQGDERVEEIVERCETYQYSLPRDEQRALIASWRRRRAGDVLKAMEWLAGIQWPLSSAPSPPSRA